MMRQGSQVVKASENAVSENRKVRFLPLAILALISLGLLYVLLSVLTGFNEAFDLV